MIFQSALDALASVLFAAPCRICAQPLSNASFLPVCHDCLGSLKPISGPACGCCGRPRIVAHQQSIEAASLEFCRLCRNRTFAFDRVRSWAVYDETLTAAIMLLKYEEVTRLGDFFAARLAELHGHLHRERPDDWRADVIVPVPLHADRRRERGYNQVDIIAKPLAKRLGLKIRPYLLARTKPRPPRLVLSRTEHWESVRGAYATPEGLRVDKLRILLVDDVMTTGATLDACSRALRKAGAAEVMALTVARVIPKWQPLWAGAPSPKS